MNREKAERCLKLGLFGALLTLIGDCLIGAAKFPDGVDLIEGYFAIALTMPAWRPILGGLIGFAGICLEFPALMTIYPLIRERMPRGGSFYKLSMYAYLALGGGAVHLPCGVFMWLYKAVTEAAGQEIGHEIALRYLLYFMLPAAAVFGVFFIGASAVQFVAFVKGRTPFPKWYCVFNLLLGKAVFNAVRRIGNTALCNGIGTSNMSLGAIVLFAALLLGWKKYVGDREHSPTAIHNHPPDIQEEYFKTHERVEADAALGYRTNCLCFILLRESARHDKLYIREVLCLQELEIIHHGQIDGISLFFDTVDYRTPHFHSEWELIWVAEGRLSIRCGADICAGQKGELFLFGPGTIHEFQKMEESATFLCLQMSPQIFETIYPGFLRMIIEGFRVNQYLGREDCSRLQRDIMELMAAYLEQAPFYELLCLGSCAQILHRLLQAMPYHRMSAEELSTADKRNARLTRFIRFVDENYTQNIRLSDFAKAEGCSVSYISRFIKSSLNQNFQEYVNSVRYYSACKLIAAGGMKMLDVCEESGFSDYRYFSDAFKRRSGMTPEEYNRQAAKPEDRNTHHSLHSMERFYTREESLALLKKLRS